MKLLLCAENTSVFWIGTSLIGTMTLIASSVNPNNADSLSYLCKSFQMAMNERWFISLVLVVTAFTICEYVHLHWFTRYRNSLDNLRKNINQYRAMLSVRVVEVDIQQGDIEQGQHETQIDEQFLPSQRKKPGKPY